MPNLVEEGNAEFQRLQQEDHAHTVIKLRTGHYDFLTAEEPAITPIHVIETRRQEDRRHGVVDANTTPIEFIKSIGVDVSDLDDKQNGISALRVEESTRAYFGNPEGEAFRHYKQQLLKFTDDMQWLKEKDFLEGPMAYERERMRYLEKKDASAEATLVEPETDFKKGFFAKKKTQRQRHPVPPPPAPTTKAPPPEPKGEL